MMLYYCLVCIGFYVYYFPFSFFYSQNLFVICFKIVI